MGRRLVAAAVLTAPLALALCGCRQAAVNVELRFPSEDSFIITNTIRIDIFDGRGKEDITTDAACGASTTEADDARVQSEPLVSAADVEACFVHAGRVRFDAVPVGRHVIVAEAAGADGTTLLRGCRVADIVVPSGTASGDGTARSDSSDAVTVEVQLGVLPSYPTPENIEILCDTIRAKCEERKPCVN